jgi:hypothetical protein
VAKKDENEIVSIIINEEEQSGASAKEELL